MYLEIIKPKKNYTISSPGIHIFYWQNISANMTFTITASGAIVYLFGLYDGTTDDRFSVRTVQKHAAPGSTSHCLIKGVFADNARFTYEGLIDITKKGSQTDATLENRNLVLSDNALVTSKPELNIIPSDVTCSHAATISHIDELQKNFMQTRGISTADAQKLIVEGFTNDLLTQRDQLHEKI